METAMKTAVRRGGLAAALLCVAPLAASAHFVFVVPDTEGNAAKVLLSENLKPDAEVDVTLIAGTRLSLRDEAGREIPLPLDPAQHAYVVRFTARARGVVHGIADLGVMKSGERAYVLQYYPKAILGDPFDGRTRVGKSAPIELVPTGRAGAVRLQLLVAGKPLAKADVTVVLPDGAEEMVVTDDNGLTSVFTKPGRYGAWARHWETSDGTRDGAAYQQTRRYATLVFDSGGAAAAAAPAGTAEKTAARVAAMPEAASSFGAAGSDGYLYVYGGHIAPTHSYSTEAVSGRLSRLRLSEGSSWERLPDGPPLQGMNLAVHRGLIYRVGGMQPRNPPGQEPDVRSVADVARFDPARRTWQALPPLPQPRSSHDVVVVGDLLIVVGGWTLRGPEPTLWPDSMDVLDLSAPVLAWKQVPQPFKRRALVAAAHEGRVYVLGGFDERSQVVHGTSIYEVARNAWSSGPALPGGPMNGFGPATAVVRGSLLVSVDDGGLFRLVSGERWERVGRATPRIVHRLVADGSRVLVIGGAAGGKNVDLVEALDLER
jgi:hypothetical protein